MLKLSPVKYVSHLSLSSSSVVDVIFDSTKQQGAPGFNGPPGAPGQQVGSYTVSTE